MVPTGTAAVLPNQEVVVLFEFNWASSCDTSGWRA